MPNCTTFLDVNACNRSKTALIVPSQNALYTYETLLNTANRVAGGLSALGVEKGERVCIHLDSSAEYLISYFAIWRIGAVAVPANRVYREGELLHVLKDAEAAAIITDAGGIETVKKVREDATALRDVVVVGNASPGTVSWSELAQNSPLVRAVDCNFDSLCHIQYTSGTTGRPKGAMLTHGNWMAALDAEREVLELTDNDVYLGIYPMGHVGVSWGMAALRAGATWIVMERYDQDRYLELAQREQATVLAGMPPVIHSLLQAPEGTEESLSTARLMISGGGPLMPGVWKPFHLRYGIPVVNAYGLSETIVVGTGTAIRPSHYATADEFLSVGTPVGFSEVKIVDENDSSRDLLPSETGEIALRGPAVAKGYWQMPEETKSVFLPEGWFLTGDIGYLDEAGMLYLTDRKKDMIVMSGWKIYPTEVENVLVQSEKIRDVAIFGCPDEHRGEIPVAAVVPESGCDLAPDEVIAYARDRVAGYKVPRRVIMVEELPRVNGWKLLRKQLRDQFCELQNS